MRVVRSAGPSQYCGTLANRKVWRNEDFFRERPPGSGAMTPDPAHRPHEFGPIVMEAVRRTSRPDPIAMRDDDGSPHGLPKTMDAARQVPARGSIAIEGGRSRQRRPRRTIGSTSSFRGSGTMAMECPMTNGNEPPISIFPASASTGADLIAIESGPSKTQTPSKAILPAPSVPRTSRIGVDSCEEVGRGHLNARARMIISASFPHRP